MSKTVLLIDSATKLIVAETNPPGDLTTIEEMEGQGFTSHSAAHLWVCRVLTPPASGLSITNGDGVAGDPTFAFTGDMAGIVGITGAGFATRSATGVWGTRVFAGTANQVLIADPDGMTGTATFSLPQDIGTGSSPTFAGLTVTGHTGVQKAVGGLLTNAVPNSDFLPGTTGAAIQKSLSGGLTGAVSGSDYAPATFTGATGVVLKNDLAGGFTGAVSGTDFAPATFTGATGVLLKNNLSGGFTGAVSGTDFAPATFTGATGVLLKNNLAGGFTAATSGTDFAPATFTGATGVMLKNDLAGGFTGTVANVDYLSGINPTVPNVISAEYITATKDRDFSATPNWAGATWMRPVIGPITDVSVTGTNNYHSVAGAFLTSGFQVGMSVTWSGFASPSNNVTTTIITLTATDMTISGATLVNVAAGASVSAYSNVWAHTAGASSTNLPSANLTATPSIGAIYQLTYDITTTVTGTIVPSIGSALGTTVGQVAGTTTAWVETLMVPSTSDLSFTPNAAWVGWIDNVSVKLVTPSALTITRQVLGQSSMTIAASGLLGSAISKFTWTNAMVVALGASLTGDIKVCTLPARTVIKNAYVVIDTSATAAGTLSGSLGITAASYNDVLDNTDLKASSGSLGTGTRHATNLSGYKFTSMTSPTDIYMHFISGTGNLSAITTCSGTVYLETVTLP